MTSPTALFDTLTKSPTQIHTASCIFLSNAVQAFLFYDTIDTKETKLKIVVNDFVKRQTKESRFSHFAGTWDELASMTMGCWENQSPGYRAGVVLVQVPARRFFSGITQLIEGDHLVGGFEPRRKGETPRKFVTSVGAQKLSAQHVDVVLYASEVLAEDGDNQLPPHPGNWEIISVNASPTKDAPPIEPLVLMHNHFGSVGGTSTGLSDKEFVVMLQESFYFWKDKAMCGVEK